MTSSLSLGRPYSLVIRFQASSIAQRLEIIAEGEIAQHLEEGVVAGGVADVLQIVVLAAGAHAFLRRGGAHVVALLDAGEDVLELHHAGIGEHQGGIVARHQRARRHDLMAVALEIVEKSPPNVVCACHVGPMPAAPKGPAVPMLVCPIPRPHPPIKAQGPVLPWPVLPCPEAAPEGNGFGSWNFRHLWPEPAMASDLFQAPKTPKAAPGIRTPPSSRSRGK